MPKWRNVKQKRDSAKQKDSSTKEVSQTSCSTLSKRLKAFLIDSFLITTPITYIVMYLILGGGTQFADNRVYGWAMILSVTALIIIFFWFIKSQTPGMKAYEIKLVKTDKTNISIIQAIIRFLATLFAMISFFLMFIPFFNKNKKTFQDIISNTIIIDE